MLYEMIAVCTIASACFSFYKTRQFNSILLSFKYWYIGIVYFIHDVHKAKHNRTELPLLSNKIAIVTGGSRGIGMEVVKKLLQCDMEVIIACRRTGMGKKLIQEIEKSDITTGRAKVYELDNASLKSIKKFVEQIKQNYDKIHILINNAGRMFPPEYEETEDGFEQQWSINYLSHFLLSSLLLPLLQNAGCPGDRSRIINITSCAHDISTIDFDYIRNPKRCFNTQASYGQSKLAQTMFTISLQELLKAKSLMVQTYSVHPGIVRTDLFKDVLVGKYKWLMSGWKTPEQGAISIVYSAVNKEIEDKGGICISNCKELRIPSQALVKDTQKKLFQLTLDQLQLHDFFEYL